MFSSFNHQLFFLALLRVHQAWTQLDQTFYLIALVKTEKCFHKNNNKKVSYFLSACVILITYNCSVPQFLHP